ncbi:uncharacterized protein LOC139929871 [Centroberyx gerrardi]
MFCAWIILFLLLPGASSFMIHNTHHSLCLEDTSMAGLVLLKKCNIDSELQKWVWNDQRMLKCVGSSRCLSAQHRQPVQTQSCQGLEGVTTGLLWDCEGDRLISENTTLLLSIDGWRLTLSHKSKHSKWRSLDEGDICQEKLRSRRASGDPQEFEAEQQKGKPVAMTEEQRQFLHWYYRTEDPTPWKFAMLALSFTCLLVGFLLLGMGSMANKNRKKIAKYKAAAALAQQAEVKELQVILEVSDEASAPSERQLQGTKPSSVNGEVEELKAGNIVVTWKDGNVSSLYSDPAAEVEALEREKEADRVEEKREEASSTELEVQVLMAE